MGFLNDVQVGVGDMAKGALRGGITGLKIAVGAAAGVGLLAGLLFSPFIGVAVGLTMLFGAPIIGGAITPWLVGVGAGVGAVVGPSNEANGRAAKGLGVSKSQVPDIKSHQRESLQTDIEQQAYYNDALMHKKAALMQRAQQNAMNAPSYSQSAYANMPDINPEAKGGHLDSLANRANSTELSGAIRA